MKTILKCKWAVSLCLATLLMAACSTEETNVPPLAENESSKLISALEIVNQELMTDTANVQMKSWDQGPSPVSLCRMQLLEVRFVPLPS